MSVRCQRCLGRSFLPLQSAPRADEAGHFQAMACGRCGLTMWFAGRWDAHEALPSSGPCRACGCERAWRMPATDELSARVCDGCGLTDWFARELDDSSFVCEGGTCNRCGSFHMAAEPTHEHLEPLSTFRTWLLGRRPSGWLSLRLCRSCGHTEWYAQPDDLRCLGDVR